ncbi:hydroxyacylglutathione hydrolase [Azospirillum sp. TSO22-1]|uniref:hydroxyacylglutathione hydrolase n=1 Tax=Azospirillum sp. TSO22-1 TaxID=716789 RepID=UPI000D603DCB|nr:hydroxyacylglutathione hydrolase [Azospirillum sp. TSO22-1]PWC36959.1 hydroxyacylglutathione hydrolase [Azospirillum sp. TSO22-1]
MEIHLVPAFNDNYIYLLRDGDDVGVVDPGDAAPVLRELERRGWRLTHILNTHHHPDHVGGNRALKERYGCPVIGARADSHRIQDMDIALQDGETASFGPHAARVIAIPGHTSGHIAFHFGDARALFCGDTLFALGCGRLFEGTPAQMWDSLSRLRDLPDDTRVYCGHEYTLSNARFAVTVDPGNRELAERFATITAQRERGEPTIPTGLGVEKRTNPFLRADDPAVQAAVGMAGADPVAVFAEIRGRKDRF